MKNILILIMFCLSPMAFGQSDQCVEENGELQTILGAYSFQSIELCQAAYKKLMDCHIGNKLRGEKNQPPRVDCMPILKALIDSKTVVKVSDF